MSYNTNDTSTIDDKNSNSNSSDNTAADFVNYILTLIVLIIMVFVYFGIGGLMLYVCKLAQSNILPTDENCFPYTTQKPNITEIKTNIFTTFTEPKMSMKLEFPYDNDNSSYKLLETMQKYKEKTDSSFLVNYFISITETLILFNNQFINSIMHTLNETFNELIIVMAGPIIYMLSGIVLLILNNLYFVYLWFVNMKWFFKKNTNDTETDGPKWDDVTFLTPIDFGFRIFISFIFVIVFILGFALLSSIPFMCVSSCIITALLYKSMFNGKPATSITIVKEVLKEYKLAVVATISFIIVLFAFTNLGALQGVISLVVISLIYFGLISIDTFQPLKETHLSPLTSFKQAVKTCNNAPSATKKASSIYNYLYKEFIGGNNLKKDLKKIGKNL